MVGPGNMSRFWFLFILGVCFPSVSASSHFINLFVLLVPIIVFCFFFFSVDLFCFRFCCLFLFCSFDF